jgi:hypothetical protein
MRILFLHSEDAAQSGAWAKMRWDQVIDLGISGAHTYERWGEFFQCPVADLGFQRTASGPVRNALGAGLSFLLDDHGIDWWEVISMQYVQQIYRIVALQELVSNISAQDEVFVSRLGLDSRVLESLLGRPIPCFSQGAQFSQKIGHLYDLSRKLTYSQLKQICWDKYDEKHRIRALLAPEKVRGKDPVILLPTAYVNVTRTALAYAETLRSNNFLLVAARSSGWAKKLPGNVKQADLAAYAQKQIDEREYGELCARWKDLRGRLRSHPVMAALLISGAADAFDGALRKWLAVRNAWINVFEAEAVAGVLSCDDVNPYTHIPGFLAKRRGITWTSAHHGALDGQYIVKQSRADVLLAKSEMERDYLVGTCKIPEDRIRVAAPIIKAPDGCKKCKSSIVFFSEDYEVSGARSEEFYLDVLPPLLKLAKEHGKDLVVKLHPAESVRDRRRILKKVLSPDERRELRMVDGPLTEELIEKMWFGCTVISTAALDCAMRGIPVFLCGWLENWPFGYLEQFAAYKVGIKLSHPREIAQIPRLLESFELKQELKFQQSVRLESWQEVISETLPAPIQVA